MTVIEGTNLVLIPDDSNEWTCNHSFEEMYELMYTPKWTSTEPLFDDEVWKSGVPANLPDVYYISNYGRIYQKYYEVPAYRSSENKTVIYHHQPKVFNAPRINETINPNEYRQKYYPQFYFRSNENKKKTGRIHRYVAFLFHINTRPNDVMFFYHKMKTENCVCDHLNRNHYDFRACNLVWGTQKQNMNNPESISFQKKIKNKGNKHFKIEIDPNASITDIVTDYEPNVSPRWFTMVDFSGELWAEIEGFEDCYVSNYGRIIKPEHYKKRLYIPHYSGDYFIVNLPKRKIDKNSPTFRVNRLVAQAFVPGMNEWVSETECNNVCEHIDCNKNNNMASNLRWTSQNGNMANKITRDKIAEKAAARSYNINKKSIVLYDAKTGNLIDLYDSVTNCAFAIGAQPNTVSQALQNKNVLKKKYIVYENIDDNYPEFIEPIDEVYLKDINCYSLNGKYIRTITDIYEFTQEKEFRAGIYACCYEEKMTCRGYQWKFSNGTTGDIEPYLGPGRNNSYIVQFSLLNGEFIQKFDNFLSCSISLSLTVDKILELSIKNIKDSIEENKEYVLRIIRKNDSRFSELFDETNMKIITGEKKRQKALERQRRKEEREYISYLKYLEFKNKVERPNYTRKRTNAYYLLTGEFIGSYDTPEIAAQFNFVTSEVVIKCATGRQRQNVNGLTFRFVEDEGYNILNLYESGYFKIDNAKIELKERIMHIKRPINMYSLPDGNYISTFETEREAFKAYPELSPTTISRCCKGLQYSCLSKWTFRFSDSRNEKNLFESGLFEINGIDMNSLMNALDKYPGRYMNIACYYADTGEFYKRFSSIKEAEEDTKVLSSSIMKCCNGDSFKAYSEKKNTPYTFRYCSKEYSDELLYKNIFENELFYIEGMSYDKDFALDESNLNGRYNYLNVYDFKSGDFIKRFEKWSDAANYYDVDNSVITRCTSGRQRKVYSKKINSFIVFRSIDRNNIDDYDNLYESPLFDVWNGKVSIEDFKNNYDRAYELIINAFVYKTGEFYAQYKSLKEAAEKMNIEPACISRCCTYINIKAKSKKDNKIYTFRYSKNEYSNEIIGKTLDESGLKRKPSNEEYYGVPEQYCPKSITFTDIETEKNDKMKTYAVYNLNGELLLESKKRHECNSLMKVNHNGICDNDIVQNEYIFKIYEPGQTVLKNISLNNVSVPNQAKEICMFDKDGKFVKKFKNMDEITSTKQERSYIYKSMNSFKNGKYSECLEHIWAYAEDCEGIEQIELRKNHQIVAFDAENNVEIARGDINQLSELLKVNKTGIYNCCYGLYKTTKSKTGKKYTFKFEENL